MIERIKTQARYFAQRYNMPIKVIHSSRVAPAFSFAGGIVVELADSFDSETVYNNQAIRYRKDDSETTSDDRFIGEDRIAIIAEKHIAILFQVTDDNSFSLFNNILETTIPKMARQWHKERSEVFTALLGSGIEKRRSLLRSSINDSKTNQENLSRQLFEVSRRINEDSQILEILEKPLLPIHRKAKRDYSDLQKLVPGMYSSIYFENEKIIAVSNYIEIYYNDYDYDLGIFEIKIDIAKGDITINNNTNPVNDFPHPHVDMDGHVCWGNIGSGIYKMLGQNEVYGLLELIHKFLYEYNSESPYQKIEYWNPDYCEEDDSYSRCRENSYGYTCVQCSDSDCPWYNGANEECAEDATLEYCTSCQYRCSYGDEMISDCFEENGPLRCMACGYNSCPNYFNEDECHDVNSEECESCKIVGCKHIGDENGETVAAGVQHNDPCQCLEQG